MLFLSLLLIQNRTSVAHQRPENPINWFKFSKTDSAVIDLLLSSELDQLLYFAFRTWKRRWRTESWRRRKRHQRPPDVDSIEFGFGGFIGRFTRIRSDSGSQTRGKNDRNVAYVNGVHSANNEIGFASSRFVLNARTV